MQWQKVGIAYTPDGLIFVEAMDFLSGVLVKIDCHPVFIAGYRIKPQTGDADCDTLERRS